MYLDKRRPPNVSSTAPSRERMRPARTPPSTFLFLPIHLSNSPELWRVPPFSGLKGRRRLELTTEAGSLITEISVRCFADTPSLSGGASVRGLYVRPRDLVNTEHFKKAAKMPVFERSAPRCGE